MEQRKINYAINYMVTDENTCKRAEVKQDKAAVKHALSAHHVSCHRQIIVQRAKASDRHADLYKNEHGNDAGIHA